MAQQITISVSDGKEGYQISLYTNPVDTRIVRGKRMLKLQVVGAQDEYRLVSEAVVKQAQTNTGG